MNVYLVIALVLVNAVATAPDTESPQKLSDISVYVPGAGEVEGWEPAGTTRTFVGEDLYSLINGGAVIFYEYGFKQVITQEYTGADGKRISLEIYQMDSPVSAYGVYTIKKGAEGKDIDVGDEGMLADYYLYFWKGDFFITLTTSDSEETTDRGLVRIARAVDSKIGTEGQRPPLVDILSIEGRDVRNIAYLKGDLALANNFPFIIDNVFNLKEGVIGDYGDFKVFVFKYVSRNEGLKRYEDARDLFKNSTEFADFRANQNDCAMIDTQGRTIRMRIYENYILIFVGSAVVDPGSILERLQQNITERLGI